MEDSSATASSQPLEYTFTLDEGSARALTPWLTATLWQQNERLHQAVEKRWGRHQSERLRPVAIALSIFGLLLSLGGAALTHRLRSFFIAAACTFALLLWAFASLTRLRQGLRSLARRLVERAARRSVASLVRYAPYDFQYRLAGRRLAIGVTSALRSRRLELDMGKVRLIVATPVFLALFARPLAARPIRLLCLPAEGTAAPFRAAVLATCATALEAQSPG